MTAKRSRPAGEPGGNKTFRGVSSIVATDHDRPRELTRGSRTRTWCAQCLRPIAGGYFGALRHAAVLGHAVDIVTEYWTTIGTFDALLDEDLRRAAES